MSDEFKKKLAALATRVEAAKQKSAPTEAELKAADVVKVNAVIMDWKKRIVPLIVKAVKDANAAPTGIHLATKEAPTHVIEVGKNDMSLPGITIAATRSRSSSGKPGRAGTIASLLAGARGAADDEAAEALPNIRISIDRGGRIGIIATNCRLTAHGPLSLEQFDERQVEAAIFDFVDALVFPPAQG